MNCNEYREAVAADPSFDGGGAHVSGCTPCQEYRDEMMSLDLRIHNGFSNSNQGSALDDPLGKVYFESIELWVPKGWTVVPDIQDPFWGVSRDEGAWTAFELVRPLGAGKMHVMPQQSSFVRRVALTTVGNEAQAKLSLIHI